MIYSAFAFQPGFSRQDIVKTQEPSETTEEPLLDITGEQ